MPSNHTSRDSKTASYLFTPPLVTKEDLLRAAWPHTVVSEWVLTTCIREIRKVLGDQPKAPRWIETVYRRGYRFIAPVITADPSTTVMTTSSLPLPISSRPHGPLIGRETELTQLHRWFDQAQGGARHVVFVTGEAGIGKTTLVDAFLE
jgi:chromosomal replication initiation ATPase DnaA